jgi:protease I
MNSEKRVLFVIPQKDFREEEYFNTKEYLENAGIQVTTASSMSGECYGVSGKIAIADTDFIQLNTVDMDGVFFIGGPGVETLFSDDSAVALANEFYSSGRMVGAICWASVMLARAGIVAGKKVAVWSGARDEMLAAGAIVVDEATATDGNIITASGPSVAEQFAQRIVEAYGDPTLL